MADNDRLHRSLLVKARVAGVGITPGGNAATPRSAAPHDPGYQTTIGSASGVRRRGGSPGIAQLKEGLGASMYEASNGASDDVVASIDRLTSPNRSSYGSATDNFDESGYINASARKKQAYMEAQLQSGRRGYVDDVILSHPRGGGEGVGGRSTSPSNSNYTSLPRGRDPGGRSRSASPPPPPGMDHGDTASGQETVTTPTKLGPSPSSSPSQSISRLSSPSTAGDSPYGAPAGRGGGGFSGAGGSGASPRRGVNWGVLQDSLDIQVRMHALRRCP
jgi:hypothetical protein